MTYFILSIFGVIAVVILKQEWSNKNKVAFVIMVIVLGGGLYVAGIIFSEISVPITKGKNSWLKLIPWTDIFLYLSMLIGMASKYFYDWIENKNSKDEKIDKWQLIKPMLVSPIVFGAIYTGFQTNTPSTLLYIFSFQNGFFWQTILKKHVQR